MKPTEARPLGGAAAGVEPPGAEPSYESLRPELEATRKRLASLEAERRDDAQKLAFLSSLLRNLPGLGAAFAYAASSFLVDLIGARATFVLAGVGTFAVLLLLVPIRVSFLRDSP